METQSISKIRIKMGQIEVEFEGTESFLKKELPDLLAAVSNLYNKTNPIEELGDKGDSPNKADQRTVQLTTSNIAAKIKCKSGSDLAKAAAAHLAMVKQKNTFTRNDILSEMKNANPYYKQNYSSNLSKILNTLIKQEILNENAKDLFSLSAKYLAEMGTLIGRQ